MPAILSFLCNFVANMKKILFILALLTGMFAGNLSAQNYNQLYENTPDGPRYINEDENALEMR